jgi:hypothetical protein
MIANAQHNTGIFSICNIKYLWHFSNEFKRPSTSLTMRREILLDIDGEASCNSAMNSGQFKCQKMRPGVQLKTSNSASHLYLCLPNDVFLSRLCTMFRVT